MERGLIERARRSVCDGRGVGGWVEVTGRWFLAVSDRGCSSQHRFWGSGAGKGGVAIQVVVHTEVIGFRLEEPVLFVLRGLGVGDGVE